MIELPEQLIIGNRHEIRELARASIAENTPVVFDCSKTEYIDSAGLGMLCGVSRDSLLAGLAKPALWNLKDALRRLTVLTRIDQHFVIAPAIDTATNTQEGR